MSYLSICASHSLLASTLALRTLVLPARLAAAGPSGCAGEALQLRLHEGEVVDMWSGKGAQVGGLARRVFNEDCCGGVEEVVVVAGGGNGGNLLSCY